MAVAGVAASRKLVLKCLARSVPVTVMADSIEDEDEDYSKHQPDSQRSV